MSSFLIPTLAPPVYWAGPWVTVGEPGAVRGVFILVFHGPLHPPPSPDSGCWEGMTGAGAGARACWLGPNLTASPLCQERSWQARPDVHSVPQPRGTELRGWTREGKGKQHLCILGSLLGKVQFYWCLGCGGNSVQSPAAWWPFP